MTATDVQASMVDLREVGAGLGRVRLAVARLQSTDVTGKVGRFSARGAAPR
jgi:hypothetical protein